MKKLLLAIGLAISFASVSFAQNWYATPRFGGGYNYYNNNGNWPLKADTLPALTGSSQPFGF